MNHDSEWPEQHVPAARAPPTPWGAPPAPAGAKQNSPPPPPAPSYGHHGYGGTAWYSFGNNDNKGSLLVGNINPPFDIPSSQDHENGNGESSAFEIDFGGSLNVGNVIIPYAVPPPPPGGAPPASGADQSSPPLQPAPSYGYDGYGGGIRWHRFGNNGNTGSLTVGNINRPIPPPPLRPSSEEHQNSKDGSSAYEIGNNGNRGSLNVGNVLIQAVPPPPPGSAPPPSAAATPAHAELPASPGANQSSPPPLPPSSYGYFGRGGTSTWYRVGNNGIKESNNNNYLFAPRPYGRHQNGNSASKVHEIGNNGNRGSFNGNLIDPPLPPAPYRYHGDDSYSTIGNNNNKGSINVGNTRYPKPTRQSCYY